MNFELSDEQRMLQDSIVRLTREQYGFEQRRVYAAAPDGWSRPFWGKLAEQGILALPFPEEYGGLGRAPVETMLIMEALGGALTLEPYLSSIVIAGAVLREASNPNDTVAASQSLIAALSAGEQIVVLAQSERQSRYSLREVGTTARRAGDSYMLNGVKVLVAHAPSADQFIVSARTDGTYDETNGISLFQVDAKATGLRCHSYRLQDGSMAGDLVLTDVRVATQALVGVKGQGLELLHSAADAAIAALAAEAVGVMQTALTLTVDYLKQRRQFGVVIGSFQSLQHYAAEMLVELEQARSMAIYAALMSAEPDLNLRRRALSQVKVQVGKSGRRVGELAVQLHGGLGVSEEYAVGHCLKRLIVIDTLFGDCDHHLGRLARHERG